MATIRSGQGHGARIPKSEIESLAIHEQPADPMADARVRGKAIYGHYCQYCHGISGDGRGVKAPPLTQTMAVTPQNFTDPRYWARGETTEARLRDAVTKGGAVNGKSVLMPAWGHTLTQPQIRDVILYVREFRKSAQPKG